MYRGIIDIGRPGNDILWRIDSGLEYRTIQHACSCCYDPIYTGGKSNELEFTA
jgi:hypothetical protein